jgi:hypothetical protein
MIATPIDAAGWSALGAHLYRFESPDLFMTRVLGDVSRQDVEATYDTMRRCTQAVDRFFWIADVSRLGRLLPEARKYTDPTGMEGMLFGIAVVGATFQQQVLVTLGSKASTLLRRMTPVPMAFCKSEVEARAWIDSRRKAR